MTGKKVYGWEKGEYCPDCEEEIVNGMFCNNCGWDGF